MAGKSSPYLARRAKKLKRVKKDYQKKCLSNPFFRQHHNNNSTNHSRRHYCWLGGLILFFVFLFYLFFISSVFTLRTIKVQGISRLPEDQITAYAWAQSRERRGGIFKQNNLFFFKTDALAASLAEKFSFDSLQVHKKWPHTLVVSASERALAFIWREANSRSFGDSQGCLVKDTEVTEADLANYPILEAAAGQNHLDQQNCLDTDKNYLQALFSLNEKLKNHPVQSKIIIELLTQLGYFYNFSKSHFENTTDEELKEKYRNICLQYGQMNNYIYNLYLNKKDLIESHSNEISSDTVYQKILKLTEAK